jgi:hypothetical protein
MLDMMVVGRKEVLTQKVVYMRQGDVRMAWWAGGNSARVYAQA